jgi:hypothetical protein
MDPVTPLLATLRAGLVAGREVDLNQRLAGDQLMNRLLQRDRERAVGGVVTDEEDVALCGSAGHHGELLLAQRHSLTDRPGAA